MIKYGPNVENLNMIHDKAKDKKDGVYAFRGLLYRVKGGKFTHFAYNGEILERYGNFNTTVGRYSAIYDSEIKKILERI